ncbi:hypothetical protein EHS86_07025 [Erwinia amylovora]|uniref:Uncharacterized protein n=2 Tax=Erwinia amylovora TaxID=552 RepID=A0A830ZZR6_ERWAM|nr:hypothetical protein AD997_04635 [Erwinia amylovora]EKV53596.1 hypothetical protein EaACW_0896 [Erwinia amylovora ACW56400]CBA19837.1 hypothetical protein predicted by Glimmer/Critica [Erwinia amylovora CFBP1430]CBJ45575.1 hypothetical protein EAM_0900 [Erwinia amylovora ATCC 49946]CCO77739.1 hypothetical protein BN432_0917 [Erwinia amylovora Ea356]CCO81525.1 hypothetical protein BN433_0930 [Erwinia amylovora Ea266]CCO85327.1 hypothetical protein BN434_0915 [Erwinia amylovora CFBP 2585]CC
MSGPAIIVQRGLNLCTRAIAAVTYIVNARDRPGFVLLAGLSSAIFTQLRPPHPAKLLRARVVQNMRV